MSEILIAAGDKASKPYLCTPLDFADPRDWWWSNLWNQGKCYMRAVGLDFGMAQRPLPRCENTFVPRLTDWPYFLFASITTGYFAIFFAAWNWSFPTSVERTLWRIACVTSLSSVLAIFIGKLVLMDLFPAVSQRLFDSWQQPSSDAETANPVPLVKKPWYARRLAYFRNANIRREPELESPLRMVLFTWVIGFAYCFARAYVWSEDFAGLRSLPPSAYDTVVWWKIIPTF